MPRTITVDGMSCGGCERNVVEALEAVPGVERARADRDAGQATIEGQADAAALVQVVREAGYEASA